MRQLNGLELAGFIKDRQLHQARNLRQAHNTIPKLAIVRTIDDPRIAAYVALKKAYAEDISVELEEHFIPQAEALDLIHKLNDEPKVTGIIIQLPLADTAQTEELVNAVAPKKDVDALGKNATLDPATPMAVLWLLAGYNVELKGKKVVVIGQGRLVGAPLTRILKSSGYDVTPLDSSVGDLAVALRDADVIISGTGTPGLVKSDMIKPGAVVVDAGTASEGGKLIGDVADDVYERTDLTITPKKGGVGPLTVCALFDNLLRAARVETKF